MNKILVLLTILASTATLANHHESGFNHMIELTSGHFGFDITDATVDLETGGNQASTEVRNYEIDLNYAHAINSNLWIQGIFSYEKTKTDVTGTSGVITPSSESEDSYGFGIAAIYNLDHDVANSFYVKAGLGIEASDDDSTSTKIDLTTFGVEIGKRWSLEKIINIKNLVYYMSATYQFGSGDTDVSGTEIDTDFDGFSINLLGVALFF